TLSGRTEARKCGPLLCAPKKSPACAGLVASSFGAYFLASSLFALPLPLAFFSPLALAFFSPLVGFASAFGAEVASFLASVAAGALGAVSDFGAWANAVAANAEAINVTSSFLVTSFLLFRKGDPTWIYV